MNTITRKEAAEMLRRHNLASSERLQRFLDSIFHDDRDDCIVNVGVFVRASFLYYEDRW